MPGEAARGPASGCRTSGSTPDRPARLYELLRAGRHVLVTADADATGALETAGLARDGLVETAVGRIGDCAEVLIRPDGVLAARGSFPVAEYLRRLAGDLVPA